MSTLTIQEVNVIEDNFKYFQFKDNTTNILPKGWKIASGTNSST